MRCRTKSPREELANSLSHGLGFVLAMVGGQMVLLPVAREGRSEQLLGAGIFSATMGLLYLCSSLYHALPRGPLKDLFLKLDYSAIYLFIAGTYTPFTLGVLEHSGGRLVCALIWGLAILGVTLRALDRLSHPVPSVGLYLLMGWMVLATGRSLIDHIPPDGVFWLVAGGVAYTVGVAFYALDGRMPYSHLVWHLFVMVGTTCHFVAVLEHAA